MSLKIKINPHTPNYNTKFIFILNNYDEQHGVTYDKRNVPQERAFVYGKTKILVSSNTHNIYIYIYILIVYLVTRKCCENYMISNRKDYVPAHFSLSF